MESLPVNQLLDENILGPCHPCGQAYKRFAICRQSTMIITTTMNTALASQLTHYASMCTISLSTVMSTASQTNTSSLSYYSDTATSSSSGISISNTDSTTMFTQSTTDSSRGGSGSLLLTSTTLSSATSVWSAQSTSSAPSDSFIGTTTASSTTKVGASSPLPPPLISPSISSTASPQTSMAPPSSLPQQRALASSSPSKAGPIAGSIIGFLLLVVIILLWFYRKRIVSRIRGNHRVAPSAEFLDVTRTLSPGNGTFGETNGGIVEAERFTSRRRGTSTSMSTHGGSRTASPLAVQRLGSSLSMHARDQGGIAGMGVYPGLLTAVGDGVPPDEPPPPFTPGKFNDPLVEKLNDATRQREELYRATAPSAFYDSQQDLRTPVSDSGQPTALRMPVAMPIPAPSIVDTSVEDSASSTSHARQDSDMTRMSHRKLFNIKAYGDPFFDSDAEEETKNTSPMLNAERASHMSMSVDGDYDSLVAIKSHAGDTSSIGWAV